MSTIGRDSTEDKVSELDLEVARSSPEKVIKVSDKVSRLLDQVPKRSSDSR